MAKRKILMYSLFGLAAISLTSVAFANWIISGIEAATTIDNVSVTVGTVVDQRLTATANVEDGTIKFDAKSDDTTGPIKYTGSTGGEDLTFAIKVKVDNALDSEGEKQSYFSGIKLEWTLTKDDAASDALKSAITNGYIVSPLPLDTSEVLLPAAASGSTSISGKEISATWTRDGSTTSVIATITFNFKWGTTVEKHGVSTAGDNPCLVSKDASQTKVTNCVNLLKAVYSANGASFTITATPVAA